ncbi:hypothetical protein VT06_16555 [Arsukibacterium sp. MJ3]|nr:hypothetical protein VT06_16555 [Arsukibacterium sp. MJ3]
MLNVSGRVSRDLDNNDKLTQSCKVIKSTPEQDQAWEKYQADNIANPGLYNLTSRSCVDYVRDGLINILGMNPGNGDFPSDLYNSINRVEPDIITRPSRGGLL